MTSNLENVWGVDADNIWAVGGTCSTAGCFRTIMKWDGAAWSAQNGGMGSHLRDVWGRHRQCLGGRS